MALERIHPDGMAATNGFSAVVVATGTRMIFVSGQVPADGDGNVVGADLPAQLDQVYANIKKCLAAAGATLADVTKTTTFVVDLQPEHRAIVGAARQRHMPDGLFPGSTLIGVTALARPEFLVEIEAVAVV